MATLLEKPKKNKSAYVWFVMDVLPTIRKENPDAKNSEIFLLAGEKWRNVDEATLKKYQEVALKDKNKYLEALETYNASITPEIQEALTKSKEKKLKSKQKKQLKALGMPKRPPNAFILFFMDYAKKNNVQGSYIKETGKVGAIWSSLSDSEKAKWNELAALKEKEYKVKLEEWETEMVSKGHLEVIHTKEK